MTALAVVVILTLLGVVVSQSIIVTLIVRRLNAAAAEERRFLVNHVLANTPSEFVTLATASRPDDTVEAVAEARGPRPSTVAPLGL